MKKGKKTQSLPERKNPMLAGAVKLEILWTKRLFLNFIIDFF